MDRRTLQERWDSLPPGVQESIRSLHVAAQHLVEAIDDMANTLSAADSSAFNAKQTIMMLIGRLNGDLESVEFRLQELWGFKQDAKYHTWWLKPKACTCPKMDNTDPAYYGAGKIINGDCPIHNLGE